jgi:hypothetical protein
VLVLAPLTHATSQQRLPPLAPGQRVRVTASTMDLDQRIATFRTVEGDVLVLAADTTLRVALGSVERLDMHAGTQGHAVRVAGLGVLIGAGFGLAMGLAAASGEDNEEVILFPAAGAVLGLLVGTVVGLASRTDQWTPVPIDRLRVSFGAPNGHLGIAAGITF